MVSGMIMVFTSITLTQDGLDSHPQVALNVAFLVDDGNTMDQRYWVHQIGQVFHSTANQSEPG